MKLYLKNARLNFVQTLFTAKLGPDPKPGDTPKFSVLSFIDAKTQGFAGDKNPDSAAGVAEGLKWKDAKEAINEAFIAAAQARWGADAMKMLQQLKAADRLAVHDGDLKADKPGYAGTIYMNSSNAIRPQVTDSRTGAAVTESDGIIYSGCRAYVVADVWAQDNPKKPQYGKRVNASLLAVSFLGDDERISGGASATADDYAALPDKPQEQAKKGAASLF